MRPLGLLLFTRVRTRRHDCFGNRHAAHRNVCLRISTTVLFLGDGSKVSQIPARWSNRLRWDRSHFNVPLRSLPRRLGDVPEGFTRVRESVCLQVRHRLATGDHISAQSLNVYLGRFARLGSCSVMHRPCAMHRGNFNQAGPVTPPATMRSQSRDSRRFKGSQNETDYDNSRRRPDFHCRSG